MVVPTMWSVGRRVLLWAVPAVLVAAFLWTLLPHDRSGAPAPSRTPVQATAPAPPPAVAVPARPGSRAPAAEIRQGDLQGTDAAGHPRWRVVADDVTVEQSRETVLLRNVRATFYQKDGGTITVTGKRGQFNTKTNEIAIEGNVHGTSSNGRELFADRLRWTPATGKVVGTGHIRLVQERFTMYADNMVSDTTLGQTQFSGHVHAAVQ